MIAPLQNMSPEMIALVAFSAGIWTPDKYSNQCVKDLAEIIVTTATSRERDKKGDEITVNDEKEET